MKEGSEVSLKKYIKVPRISNQKIRQKYYSQSSITHPAKADIPMMIWILKKFVDDGDIVLDPMCGIGTTLIEGMRLFPNSLFIGVELEDKFVKMARANIKKVEQITKKDMFMKIGKAVCLQGDARDLSKIMKEKVNKIISSPPFGPAQSGGGIAKKGYDGPKHTPTDMVGKRSYMYGEVNRIITSPPYSEIRMDGGGKNRAGMKPYTDEPADTWRTQRDQRNIGNLPHGKVDKIISSPPYEEAMGKKHHSPANTKITSEKNLPNTYTERVDKIVSSPPFEQTISSKAGGPIPEKFNSGGCRKFRSYSSNQENIGNLKGKTYLGEMLKVYEECFKILKASGLMILITKDFIRDQKTVSLGEDTIKLCQAAGFIFKEIYHRKIEHLSFWRILYQQKYPQVEKIDSEDILVFEKS